MKKVLFVFSVIVLFFAFNLYADSITSGLESGYNWLRIVARSVATFMITYAAIYGMFNQDDTGIKRAVYIVACAIVVAIAPELVTRVQSFWG